MSMMTPGRSAWSPWHPRVVAAAPARRWSASGRRWFADHGVGRVSVVTQARNAAGLRLYQRAGMTVQSIQLWFHKWW